jgi:hypothetical protein
MLWQKYLAKFFVLKHKQGEQKKGEKVGGTPLASSQKRGEEVGGYTTGKQSEAG